jgi:hypothetical protein
MKKTNEHDHPPSKKPKMETETDGSNEKSMKKQNPKIVNNP